MTRALRPTIRAATPTSTFVNRRCDNSARTARAGGWNALKAKPLAGRPHTRLEGGVRWLWYVDRTIIWCDYTSIRVRNVLTNPAYAGAYVYGRRAAGRREWPNRTSQAWAAMSAVEFQRIAATCYDLIAARLPI